MHNTYSQILQDLKDEAMVVHRNMVKFQEDGKQLDADIERIRLKHIHIYIDDFMNRSEEIMYAAGY